MLVVDDEEGPRRSLKMIFNDDYNVTMAASGEEAIALNVGNPFDIVITDIRMRGMNGIDVLREIKRVNKHTEVIVLTAYETLETARQAISLGAFDYLKKPFDLEHIQQVITRCYENYRLLTNGEAVLRESLNAAKTNFLEIVSHELNTPMNGILGFIELLEETSLNKEQREFIETIKDCSCQYFDRVQDILTYAKLSMSEVHISNKPFNPSTLVLKIIGEEKPPSLVRVLSDLPEMLPQFVNGPENEIKIMLRKLYQNSLKFTLDGEVRISLTSEPLPGDKYRLHFSVSDTGVGIEKRFIEEGKIFDAFTQGDSSCSRSFQGLGMGLALCKAISDHLKANLSVTSQLGLGSHFKFSVLVDSAGG